MTIMESQQQALGRAVVSADASDEVDPRAVSFTARGSGRLGPLTLAQLVIFELAALLVVGGLQLGLIHLAVGSGIALVLVVTMLLRSGDRWWYQTIPLKRRLRRRVYSLDPQQHTDVLHRIAPDLGVKGVEVRDESVGFGQDAGGWFTIIQINATDDVIQEIPLERLERLFDGSTTPVTSLQLVGHTTPVGLAAYSNNPAAQSYRELLGNTPVVIHHKAWLAVRLGVGDGLSISDDRGGGPEGAIKGLTAATQRVSKLLANIGIPNRILNAEGVQNALQQSLGVAFAPVQGERTMEDWDHWYADGLRHVSYRITQWPSDPQSLRQVVDAFAAVPAVYTTVSLIVTGTEGGQVSADGRVTGKQLAIDAIVRVALDETSWDSAQNQVLNVADDLGVKLQRFDGEQGPAAYASAPTGGGPR
ncbi:type VII secretion protein EccE [Haloglycomyces albus]|uniref:type VII secretion protein EccE n=1 Tax=Haloglycomyces albus TaxID=526067 RepID=UPI00046D36E3|nr:type VII secretion protein EccE [Haloglycomyces albus]